MADPPVLSTASVLSSLSSLTIETPPSANNLPLISWHASGITKILQEEAEKLANERKKLEHERSTFDVMKTKIAAIHFPQKLKLNVGGQVFATTRETLLREKDSLFSNMFSGSGFKVEPDEEGAYFIDRDGSQFRHILNYLRTGKVVIPENKQDLEELLDDLDFYQISSYIKAIKDVIQVDCVFERIGDNNGVFYWLGTAGRQSSMWTNPVSSGKVHLMTSGGAWFGGNNGTVVERSLTPINGGICKLAPTALPTGAGLTGLFGAPSAAFGGGAPAASFGAFGAPTVAPSFGGAFASPPSPANALGTSTTHFQLDLPVAVLLSGYSARRGNCKAPTNWRFEGSSDSVTWIPIRTHENDLALHNATEAYWETASSATETFRCFRWISADANQCLHLSCIELYGTFAKPSSSPATAQSPPFLGPSARRILKPSRSTMSKS